MSHLPDQLEDSSPEPPAMSWDGLAGAMVRLKGVPRTGWLLRGVPAGEAESVAAHSWGSALVALALAELHPEPVDVGRLLAMCLLHDLAESVLGDLPGPANIYLPPGAKQGAERQALAGILAGLPFAPAWHTLWEEFEAGASVEARLARDADRLDMLIQASGYEAAGRRNLGEFWQGATGATWHSAGGAGLAQQLLARHGGAGQPCVASP